MKGSFTKFSGFLLLDSDDITRSEVSLSLDLRSAQLTPDQILQAVLLQTAIAHLRPPETSFTSTRIERRNNNNYLVHGQYQWQSKLRSAVVPIQILRSSPGQIEVRVTITGAASPGKAPKEAEALGGIDVAGAKGWAQAKFIFTRKG